jgi:hypothetical protein
MTEGHAHLYAVVRLPGQEFLSPETEMPTVIETDDVETEFAERLFFRFFIRYERLGDFSYRAALHVKTGNGTDDLDLSPNAQFRHTSS